MDEIVNVVGCDLHQLGSMCKRVVEYLGIELGEFDLVNGVKCRIDDLARDCEVSLCTCKLRYKELLERLVKVAKEIGLPWAKDVTVKNVVKHSGALIGLMEAKSMRKKGDRSDGVCLKEIVRDCLSKEAMYCYDDDEGQRSSFLQMVSCEDWWKGKSKMSQRLELKEVLEKDDEEIEKGHYNALLGLHVFN
ncbi:hypothetical protein Bca52824_093385 [Brassica carinata]|uniref:Uncharacterized protein n=1 Tax=Brassica carinata TaxID=52824 RepID=A0A8X7P5T9_BRACI|nr:hypothetical protein Bca52824_093385 [Brassica carinata]